MKRAATAFALILSLTAVASAKLEMPTRREPVVETVHGVEVADPYRWLEDGASPEVQSWTEAQNAVTRRRLDGLPGRAALQRRYGELFEIGALGLPASRKHGAGRRYFYSRRDGNQNQPVLYVRDGIEGADRAVVDVNGERADGTRSLDWWVAPTTAGRLRMVSPTTAAKNRRCGCATSPAAATLPT